MLCVLNLCEICYNFNVNFSIFNFSKFNINFNVNCSGQILLCVPMEEFGIPRLTNRKVMRNACFKIDGLQA